MRHYMDVSHEVDLGKWEQRSTDERMREFRPGSGNTGCKPSCPLPDHSGYPPA